MIDNSIQQWRQSLDGLSAQQIDELEDHLRSSLPELLDQGLSIDDAVLLAAARLEGAADASRETKTTPTVRHPILRTLLGVLVCVAAGFGCLISAMFTLYALAYQHITPAGTGLALGIGGAACASMVYLIRKAVIDIHRTTTGIPATD